MNSNFGTFWQKSFAVLVPRSSKILFKIQTETATSSPQRPNPRKLFKAKNLIEAVNSLQRELRQCNRTALKGNF